MMEWYWLALTMLAGLLIMMTIGLPIAFCFLFISLVLAFILWGGGAGVETLVSNIAAHMTRFVFLPLALFILMGEVVFHSGIAPNMITALDNWLGASLAD